MPQNKSSKTPPKVMTWPKALPILALSLIFDAVRLLFEMFWFFGPAIAALYCTSQLSGAIGAVAGGALCSVGAGAVGFLAAGPIAAFGVITAIAVGLLGWMTIGLILIMTNARLFKDHAGHSLWFIGSLLLSEIPFIGALPAITVSVAKMYSAQIKNDKAALAAYEKAQAKEQNLNREQQAAETTQARNAKAVQIQQEAANDEMYAEAEQEKEPREVMNEKRYEPAPARVIPHLATVPNYTGIAKPLDENRYQKFAGAQKARWAEQGANPLTEAARARDFAKIELESGKQSIEKYRERVENLRSNIDEKKSSLIGRVLDFRKIQILERDLSAAERVQSSAEQMAKSREELFTAYDRIVSEQQKLGTLLEESSKENTALDERKRLEFVEEEKKRDVANLARTHNTYFVHDIFDGEGKPSENNRVIDTKNLNWEDQLDILTGLHPTISASTIDQGGEQRTFGGKGWGAFISSGRVLGGGRDDLGTVAVGLRDRRFMSKEDTTTEAIEGAISGREGTRYNEVVVEQPEIAGVYCKWGEHMPPLADEVQLPNQYVGKDGTTYRYGSWWEKMRSVTKRNIPVFVLDANNKAHLIHDIDFEKRTFKVAAGLTPEDVQNMPGIYKQHIGSEEEKAAIGRVFDSVSHLLSEEEKKRFAPLPKAVNDEIPDGVRKAA